VSLFSFAVVFVIAICLFIEISRGINRGVRKTSVTLGVVILSIFAASLITSLTSGLLMSLAQEMLRSSIDSSFADSQFPSIAILIPAYVVALVSPVVFLILFWLCRMIFSMITRLLYKTKLKNSKNDAGFDTKDARWSAARSKGYGGAIGAICGFITAAVVLSPFLGTLNVASKVIGIFEKNDELLEEASVDYRDYRAVKWYAEELPISIMYYSGAGSIYNSVARASLEGEKIVILKEIDNINTSISMVYTVVDTFKNIDSVTSDKITEIGDMLSALSDSPTFSMLAKDFLSGASRAWLSGTTYMGVESFVSGGPVEPLISEMLKVCSSTSKDTVNEDLMTVLHVLSIAVENGLSQTDDYAAVIEKMNDGMVITRLCEELEKNPRMSYISDGIWEVSMKAMAYLVEYYNYQQGQYEGLMQQLADSMNEVKGYKYDQRVEKMSQYAISHFESIMGIAIPKDIALIMAEAMDSEIYTVDGTVRVSDVKAFFEFYAK